MPSLTPSIQEKREEITSASTSIPSTTLLTNDEFKKFLFFFNQKKTAYNDDTFHPDDVSRLNNDPWWASCFVKQNKQNIEKAAEAAAKTLKWRSERKVAEIQEDSMDKVIRETESVFVNGRALDGTRVLYMIVKKFGGKQSKCFQDLLIYWLETLQRNETGHEVTFVMQVDGAKVSNIDISNIRFIMTCLDVYFPAIFKRVIIVDMPWLLNTIWQMVKQWLSDDQRERVHLITSGKMRRLIPKPHKLSALDGENIWRYAAVERAKQKNVNMQKKSCKPARPHQISNHCGPLMAEQATQPHLVTTNDQTQTWVEKNTIGTNVVAIRKKPSPQKSKHSVTKTWSGSGSLKSHPQDSQSKSHHGGSQHHEDSVESHDSSRSHQEEEDSVDLYHPVDNAGSQHSHHDSIGQCTRPHPNKVKSECSDHRRPVGTCPSYMGSNASRFQSSPDSDVETKCSDPELLHTVLSNKRLPRAVFSTSQSVEKIFSHDDSERFGVQRSRSHQSALPSEHGTLDNIYASVFHEKPAHEHRDRTESGRGSTENLLRAVPSDAESDRSARIENKIYLCPARVITFKKGVTDESDNRYKKDLQIANCTPVGNQQELTYKIKTNAPDSYYVKPSMGIIRPGETKVISLTLDKNKADDVSKDRFMILFNRCEDTSQTIAKFWKEKEKDGSFFQHRLKVRVIAGSMADPSSCESDGTITQVRRKEPNITPPNRQSIKSERETHSYNDAGSSTYEDAVNIHLSGKRAATSRSRSISDRNDDKVGVPNTQNRHSDSQSESSFLDRSANETPEQRKRRVKKMEAEAKLTAKRNLKANRKPKANESPETTEEKPDSGETTLNQQSTKKSDRSSDEGSNNAGGVPNTRNRSSLLLSKSSKVEEDSEESSLLLAGSNVPNTRNRKVKDIGRQNVSKPLFPDVLLRNMSVDSEETSDTTFTPNIAVSKHAISPLEHGITSDNPVVIDIEAVTSTHSEIVRSEETNNVTSSAILTPALSNTEEYSEESTGLLFDNPIAPLTRNRSSLNLGRPDTVSVEYLDRSAESAQALNLFIQKLTAQTEENSDVTYSAEKTPSITAIMNAPVASETHVAENSDKKSKESLVSFSSTQTQNFALSKDTQKYETSPSKNSITTKKSLPDSRAIANAEETIPDFFKSNNEDNHSRNERATKRVSNSSIGSISLYQDAKNKVVISKIRNDQGITFLPKSNTSVVSHELSNTPYENALQNLGSYIDAEETNEVSPIPNNQGITSLAKSETYATSKVSTEIANTPYQNDLLSLSSYVNTEEPSEISSIPNNQSITSLAKPKISVISKISTELSNLLNVQDVSTQRKSKLAFDLESRSTSTPTDQGAVLKSRVLVDSEEISGLSNMTNDQRSNALHQSKTSVTSKKSSELSSTVDQSVVLKSRLFVDAEETNEISLMPNDQGQEITRKYSFPFDYSKDAMTEKAKISSKYSISSQKLNTHLVSQKSSKTSNTAHVVGILKSRIYVGSEETSDEPFIPKDQMRGKLTAESDLDVPTTSYDINVMNTRNRNSLLESVDDDTSINNPKMNSLDIDNMSRSTCTTAHASQTSLGTSISKTSKIGSPKRGRYTLNEPLVSEQDSTEIAPDNEELVSDEVCRQYYQLPYKRVFSLVIIFVWALMYAFMLFYYYSGYYFIPRPCPTLIDVFPVIY